jgi:hypothetical protein
MMIRNQPMDSNHSPGRWGGASTEADDLSASHGETDAIGMRAESAFGVSCKRITG